MALGVALNCLLDPLFIFGKAGFPRLGVEGSAVATIISRLVTVTIIILLARGQSTYFDLSRAFGRINLPLMGRIVRIGLFSSVEMLIRSLAMIALLRIVAPFGPAALAAYGIGTRVRRIIMMPGIGMGFAAGTLVGQNLGAGLAERARRTAWMTWRIYQALILPILILLFLFPRPVIGFFNRDPRVLADGQVFISYISVSFFFLSFTMVLGKALHGAGDTLGPMVIAAVSLIVLGIPLAYAGSRFQGVEGVWQGILAAAVLNGLLIMLRFRRGAWLHLKFMED
jgi:putative MATE family efflux protein